MIRVKPDAGVGRVTLARPETRNALTPEMLVQATRAIRGFGDETRCVLIGGEGPVFCAGFDLSLCKESPDGSLMRSLLTGLHELIGALREFRSPVVLAAQGAAIAGGCALLAGADFVVADADARFGYPVTRLGVSPAVSAPTLAPRIGFGPSRARLLDSGLIDGREAARRGLVTDLVERPEDVAAGAGSLAAELASKPAHATRATRRWLGELDGTDDAWRSGLAASLALTGGDEERELLAAFWSR